MKLQQMDLKTFAESDFDPKEWINKAWSSSGDQEKEVFVGNAVGRLQLYMKQLTNSLDEATTQIVTSLPRVVQDVSVLHEEATLLQQKLLALEQTVYGVEEQTGHSIESLQKIDKLKSKLESAALTLHEADKWAALTSSLENILETGVPTSSEKLTELSDQVAAMTQSLELMSDASDYDTKRVQLETLYNRLEAAISPPFINALTQMDSERTQRYVRVYAGMARCGAAAGWARRAAAGALAARWRALPAPDERALAALLAREARVQVEWLANVLKSDTPLTELVRLYTDLLLSLEPSPTKIATEKLKLCANAEEGILQLIDLKGDIDHLVAGVRAELDAPRANRETISAETMGEFERAALAPIRGLLPRYCELQTQELLRLLAGPAQPQVDLLERSKEMFTIVERCEDWLSTAFTRSQKIAGTEAYPYYVSAVEQFVCGAAGALEELAARAEAEGAARGGGVLSAAFAAALALEAAAAALATAARRALPAPCPAAAPADAARARAAALAAHLLKRPVDAQLETVPALEAWSSPAAAPAPDLPQFALAPQEYITEVGQYLMTLPQHLEMHLAEKRAPWQLLSEVCVHTCEVYAEKILTIRNMDATGARRCLTDIAYLCSVVEELGATVSASLRAVERSLRDRGAL